MKEEKLVKIEKAKKIIFVGDTHGDFSTTKKVIENYFKPEHKIVFLGDYVDRGKNSKENIDFLLEMKEKYPEQIILLQGNHEGYPILKFSPAEFWESLSQKEYQFYSQALPQLPLVAITKDIIALHGALPEIENLEKVNEIKLGSENWFQIVWGDFLEKDGEKLGIDFLSGRPQFGRDYFFKLMKKFNKKILIRAHQPDAPLFMFKNRCLTLFTSLAYKKERKIAIYNFSSKGDIFENLKIVRI